MADADYQLRLETSSAERVRAPDSREALEPELQLHADAEEAASGSKQNLPGSGQMRSPLGGIRADEFERVSSSRRLISPVGGKSDECCGANDSGLAVLIGHLRPDVDQSQLKNQLTQLLQRRMVQVSANSMHVMDRDGTRSVLVQLSTEADQDRMIDALLSLDPAAAAATDEGRGVAEQLVLPGHAAVVSVITPMTVAEAMRTISFKQSYCRRDACRIKFYVRGENVGRETRCREFKLGRGNLDTHLPDAVPKYVSSFLNSEGGTLMLGINDKGEVVGVPHIDHAREDKLRQQIDKIVSGIEPAVFPNSYGVRFVPVRQPNSDTDIPDCKVIEICTSQGQPGVLYQTPKGEVFVRRDGSVQGPLRASDIQNWTRQNEVHKREMEAELVELRERERQLQEEVEMRRLMDAFTQRQMYQLVKGEDELKRISDIQLEEIARLSSRLQEAQSSSPPPRENTPGGDLDTTDEMSDGRRGRHRRRRRDRDKHRRKRSGGGGDSVSKSRSSASKRRRRASSRSSKIKSRTCTIL